MLHPTSSPSLCETSDALSFDFDFSDDWFPSSSVSPLSPLSLSAQLPADFSSTASVLAPTSASPSYLIGDGWESLAPLAPSSDEPDVQFSLTNGDDEGTGRVSLACTPCRLRKSKCDGDKTSCARCTRRGISCHYPVRPPPRASRPSGARRTSAPSLPTTSAPISSIRHASPVTPTAAVLPSTSSRRAPTVGSAQDTSFLQQLEVKQASALGWDAGAEPYAFGSSSSHYPLEPSFEIYPAAHPSSSNEPPVYTPQSCSTFTPPRRLSIAPPAYCNPTPESFSYSPTTPSFLSSSRRSSSASAISDYTFSSSPLPTPSSTRYQPYASAARSRSSIAYPPSPPPLSGKNSSSEGYFYYSAPPPQPTSYEMVWVEEEYVF